jgi:1,4-dihydroxy-2-naphthoate octaprenyltransferase
VILDLDLNLDLNLVVLYRVACDSDSDSDSDRVTVVTYLGRLDVRGVALCHFHFLGHLRLWGGCEDVRM